MAAGSNPTQSLKREREMDDGALMPPTQISKRNHEGNDASPGVEPRKLLELDVKDTNGMWWPMPLDLSDRLLEGWCSGENRKVLYVGDWEGVRAGSYVRPDGEETSFNVYSIDFATMRQRKFPTKCEYRIKIVEVLAKGAATE